jgi:dynein heavy chain, axonemal
LQDFAQRSVFLNIEPKCPVFAALAEARDIALHLKPLQRQLSQLEELTDFSEAGVLLRPLLHVICLIWTHSDYYRNTSKLVVLLRQLVNLLVQQAKRFLDPSSIFQSDIDEAKQRVQISIQVRH